MRLYDVADGSTIRIIEEPSVAFEGPAVRRGDQLLLDNIEGLLATCTNLDGETVLLHAGLQVEVVAHA